MIVGFDEQLSQHCLAVDKSALSFPVAVQFQQVEAPRTQMAGAAFHQCVEVGLAVTVAYDDLGID